MRLRDRLWVFACAASPPAFAQPATSPPPPMDAPAPPTEPAQTASETTPLAPPAPAAPPTQAAAAGRTVQRDGIMLLGGLSLVDGEGSQFVVVYLPLRLPGAPHFKLGLTAGFNYERSAVYGGPDLVAVAYSVLPLAQYDWLLPVASRHGDTLIAVQGGVAFGQVWIKAPRNLLDPTSPSEWQHITGYGLNAGIQFQFHTHGGLVLSLQPAGLSVPLNSPEPPGPGWTVEGGASFELSIAAGYRFR